MTRRVVEAMLVSHDPNMRKVAEEYQRAKLVLCFRIGRFEPTPQSSRAAAFKIYSRRLINAPDKTGTVEGRRAGGAPVIGRAEAFFNCSRKKLADLQVAASWDCRLCGLNVFW